MQIKGINRVLTLTSLLGILLSTYTLYVELKAETQPGYKALCDISERASCSKVLTSKYAKGLGLVDPDSPLKVPNCVYGIIFYSLMVFLTTFDAVFMVRAQILLSLTSLVTCVYLAYLLIFVLQDFCIVCVSTYVVNIAAALLLKMKHNTLTAKNK